MEAKNRFTFLLMKWNKDENRRQMPWKGEKDPYKIWLSEIILQQTRVGQGLTYYNKFLDTYPDIQKLAAAEDEKVFKLWEGLGYYERCRNLMATARFIAGELQGKFPDSIDEIRSLKGVGPYTAAAIASFAFNLPHAVVDGNVIRLLSRYFGYDKLIDSIEGKTFLAQLANELLEKNHPGSYNQAIMDFGAVVCKPVNPLCSQCIFKKHCIAFQTNRVNELPVRKKKSPIQKRYFYYLLPEFNQRVVLCKRKEDDIWRDLYEFPIIEARKDIGQKQILQLAEKKGILMKGNYDVVDYSRPFRQQLSHRLIAGRFIQIRFKSKPPGNSDWLWVRKKIISEYAFPKFINVYLHEQFPMIQKAINK